MSDLVVIAFATKAKAEEVRQKLMAMQKEYLVELGTPWPRSRMRKARLSSINW